MFGPKEEHATPGGKGIIKKAATNMNEEEKEKARAQLEDIMSNAKNGMVMLLIEEAGDQPEQTHVHGTFYCHDIDESTRARVGIQALNLPSELVIAWGFKLLHGKGDA